VVLKAIQVITEGRRAFADRNAFLGDPDFVKIPVKEWIPFTSKTE
jgi:gamma-glutamyltranspeptidase/glutathione hydrolase